MSRRIYLLDPEKLKEKRKEKKWSQRKLLDHVAQLEASHPGKGFGLSLRHLKNLEKPDSAEAFPVTEGTLITLEKALDCSRYEIVSCTLVDPFFVPPLRSPGNEKLLQAAIRSDVSGKPVEARDKCQALLDSILPEDGDRTAVLVRLLTFMEHTGSPGDGRVYEEAIQLGEDHLRFLDREQRSITAERGWLSFQVGICHRQLAISLSEAGEKEEHLREAEVIFGGLVGSKEHKAAAQHQLGVVALERFKVRRRKQELLRKAEGSFKLARAEWERLDDHRIGFADRRLAEVSEELKEYATAFKRLHAALVTFARHRMQRDIAATLERLEALVEKCLA